MSSLYGPGSINGPYNAGSQMVIPQITIPNLGTRYEPLTAKGRDAAYAMYIPPSTRAPIFDTDEQIFYYKETDERGNVIAFDVYDYTKRVEAPPPEYLTVDAFNTFVGQFNEFKEEIRNAQSVRSQGSSETKPTGTFYSK